MDLHILQLLAHLARQDEYFLLLPPEHVAEQAQGEALEPLQHLRDVEHADLLELRVLGPGPDGEAEPLVHDLGEAGVPDPLLQGDARAGVAADLARRREEGVDPFLGVVLFGQGAVFRVVLQVEVLELGPAAGDEVAGGSIVSWDGGERGSVEDELVDVSDEPGPVFDAGGHVAAEDVVEGDVV